MIRGNGTLKVMQKIADKMKELTGSAINVSLDVWSYESGDKNTEVDLYISTDTSDYVHFQFEDLVEMKEFVDNVCY